MPKSMTVRLPDDLAADLEAVARVDGMPVSEAVRAALEDRIKNRREDKAFQDRLKQSIEENQRALERLAR